MPSTRRALVSTAVVVLLSLALVAPPAVGTHGDHDDSTASDIDLTQEMYVTERGGVSTFTATGIDGTARFEIGDANTGYRVVLVANDTDGDGRVAVRFDTYRSPDGAAAYTVVGDDEAVSFEVVDGVSRVLAPTTYDVVVRGDGDPTISAFIVEERSPELRTLTAPAADDLTTREAIQTGLQTNASDCRAPVSCDPAVTRTTTVAHGDQLVVAYDDPVVGRVLATQNTTVAGFSTENATTQFLAAVETGGLTFDLRATGDDETALESRLGTNNTRVVPDRANGTHYLVVNTTRLLAEPTADTTLTMRAGAAPDRMGNATATGNVTLVPPSARLVTETVPSVDEPTLTATTNLAPGTDLRLLVRTRDDASRLFIKSEEVTTGPDGRVRGTLDVDLSESEPGDRFTVRPIRPPVADDLFDTEVVVQSTTPTPTPTPTPVPTRTPTQTPEPTTVTDVPTPGLGAVVALLALLAAVGLARRR